MNHVCQLCLFAKLLMHSSWLHSDLPWDGTNYHNSLYWPFLLIIFMDWDFNAEVLNKAICKHILAMKMLFLWKLGIVETVRYGNHYEFLFAYLVSFKVFIFRILQLLLNYCIISFSSCCRLCFCSTWWSEMPIRCCHSSLAHIEWQ